MIKTFRLRFIIQFFVIFIIAVSLSACDTTTHKKAKSMNAINTDINLGRAYYHGNNVPKDYAKSTYWFNMAAKSGNAVAENDLARAYAYGYGIKHSNVKASYWYHKSAEQGYAKAEYHLGCAYNYGYGVKQNYAKANFWLKKAADQKNALSARMLEINYCMDESVSKSTGKSLCAMTSTQAKYLAYKSYNNGTPQYFLPLEYAAKSGDVAAESWEGAYLNKMKDYKQAIHWYKKAAAKGYAMAENNLGNDYHQGQGVPQNYVKANYWWEKAAAQGFAAAEYNLGVDYHQGLGFQQNYVKANYWWKKAAVQGFARAENHLGNDYYHGNGFQQNYTKANYWFIKASADGDAMADYNLGLNYYKGKGVPRNITVALSLLEKAESQGGRAARLARSAIQIASANGYNGSLSYYATAD